MNGNNIWLCLAENTVRYNISWMQEFAKRMEIWSCRVSVLQNNYCTYIILEECMDVIAD